MFESLTTNEEQYGFMKCDPDDGYPCGPEDTCGPDYGESCMPECGPEDGSDDKSYDRD